MKVFKNFKWNFFLFKDSSTDLRSLEEQRQTYSGFLQDSLQIILGIRDCPVDRMTLCVTSEPEMEKCVKMKVRAKPIKKFHDSSV